jgi:hypothetical protein
VMLEAREYMREDEGETKPLTNALTILRYSAKTCEIGEACESVFNSVPRICT